MTSLDSNPTGGAEARCDRSAALAEAKWMLDLIKSPGSRLPEETGRKVASRTVKNFGLHVNSGFLAHRKSATMGGDFAVTEWEGKGSLIRDTLGREFIDLLGGFGLYSYGLRHPKIVEAVEAQLHRSPQYSQEMLDPLRAELARVVSLLTPAGIQKGFFANSGTEAVEGALKLAKLYTGKRGVISMMRGFHGKTLGSLSVTGKAAFRTPVLPLLEGVRFVPYGCACAVERELDMARAAGDGVAAVIVEPVQGEAGGIVPPADFLPKLREICSHYGVLLIVDEVQTGFGRTGRVFGVDHSGVAPDIMCFGKALGGGVVPCSAFFSTAKIWEVMEPNPFMHTTTTGGNPLACAAALAAIEVMLEEDTPRQAEAKGAMTMSRLCALKDKHPELLTSVSGSGLLIGMRFTSADIGYRVAQALFRRRVLTAGTLISAESIRIEPALNIPVELLDEALGRLEEALSEVSEAVPRVSGGGAGQGSRILSSCPATCGWGHKCRAAG